MPKRELFPSDGLPGTGGDASEALNPQLDPDLFRPAPAGPPLMESPVAAGFPTPVESRTAGPLDLNELLVARPAATFFVRAAGDSMLGAGIQPGDILVADRSLEAVDGSIVIAAVNGEFTVKTFRRDPASGAIRLEPANRRYRALVFEEGAELRLFGVVTAIIRQLVKRHAPGKFGSKS